MRDNGIFRGVARGVGNLRGPSVAAFSPLDLSPVLWLDASDESTITESAGSVSQWNDKSGNGNHAVQATGSLQPTTGTLTQNGLNVLDFGDLDRLELSPLTSLTACTTFIVRKETSANSTLFWWTNSDFSLAASQSSTNIDLVSTSQGGTSVSHYIDGGIPFVEGDGTTRGDVYNRINNAFTTQVAKNTKFSTMTSGIAIGGYNAAGYSAVGQIAEIIFLPYVATAVQINQVGQYLADKWGITWEDIPLPVSLGAVLWLDASDVSTITESGGAVSQWNDKSGNGNHAVQATASVQPLTGVATINGNNVLTFNNDHMQVAGVSTSGNYTVFCVEETTASTRTIQYVWSDLAGSYLLGLFREYSGSGDASGLALGPSLIPYGVNLPENQQYIHLTEYDGTNYKQYLDGVLKGSLSFAIQNLTDIFIGSRNDGFISSFYHIGNIAEFLVFPELTVAEKNQVGQYLAAKWGITWSDIT